MVTAPATKPEGCTRDEQNAGPEWRLNLKFPCEPNGRERHGAGSCSKTETRAEHRCQDDAGASGEGYRKTAFDLRNSISVNHLTRSSNPVRRGQSVPLGQPLDACHHRGREDYRQAAITSHFFSNAEGGFWAFLLTSPGCRTRRAGAPFAAPGKRRDRPRVGRKERSDWSRQPGVMRSVASRVTGTI